MQGAILRTSYIQLHLILPAILHLIKRSRYYYPYFIVEETEAQKDIQLKMQVVWLQSLYAYPLYKSLKLRLMI